MQVKLDKIYDNTGQKDKNMSNMFGIVSTDSCLGRDSVGLNHPVYGVVGISEQGVREARFKKIHR